MHWLSPWLALLVVPVPPWSQGLEWLGGGRSPSLEDTSFALRWYIYAPEPLSRLDEAQTCRAWSFSRTYQVRGWTQFRGGGLEVSTRVLHLFFVSRLTGARPRPHRYRVISSYPRHQKSGDRDRNPRGSTSEQCDTTSHVWNVAMKERDDSESCVSYISYRSGRSIFSAFGYHAIASILAINAFFCLLAINSVLSIGCINCILSIFSMNSFMSIGCVNSAFCIDV